MKRNITHTIIVAAIVVLAAGAYLFFKKPSPGHEQKSEEITCINNLKQITIAFQVWVSDQGGTNNQYPFNVSTNRGGVMELCVRDTNGFAEKAAPIFKVMGNELHSPVVVACPQDQGKKPAKSFGDLKEENVTYRVRIGSNVSETNPSEVLVFCPVHGYSLLCDGKILDADKKEIQAWPQPQKFASPR